MGLMEIAPIYGHRTDMMIPPVNLGQDRIEFSPFFDRGS